MMVGELIDLLEPFRGRGDSVIIEDDYGYVFTISNVRWDDVVKCVVVNVEEAF